MSELSHIKKTGEVNMVDVTEKDATQRTAIAKSIVVMSEETLKVVLEGDAKKGDVIATAKIAGVMAAKKTHEMIPMCHPLSIEHVEVNIEPAKDVVGLEITAVVKVGGKTGVEMEALTAVSVAALTIYDMAKSVQKDMVIGPTKLVQKSGGKSGEWKA